MTADHLIGADGDIPWQLPDDLQLFKQLTMGQALIMGRTTFESLGRPLPGRDNIVISSTLQATDGIDIYPTFGKGLAAARKLGKDIFFVGGAEIYRAALLLVDRLHISWVEGDFFGDTFFPEIDFTEWEEIERTPHQGFTYTAYLRKK